jgi:hypothetical protein
MALVDSVRAGLDQLGQLDPRDQAAADLALLLAARIDDTDDWQDRQRDPLAELAPKLLAVLVQLGMTPAARKGIVGDKPEPAPRSPLDQLRDEVAQQRAKKAT